LEGAELGRPLKAIVSISLGSPQRNGISAILQKALVTI
jgi:hypothetical protein